MLPLIVERLQAQHPDSKLSISSVQDDVGGDERDARQLRPAVAGPGRGRVAGPEADGVPQIGQAWRDGATDRTGAEDCDLHDDLLMAWDGVAYRAISASSATATAAATRKSTRRSGTATR